MGLFNKKTDSEVKNEGGLMDVIRCDEESYLIWKWRPAGMDAGTTKKENSIRYGSRLRVKDGEVAVFVYPQKNGSMQDFIEGPYDEVLKTANFPVLSSIVGLAFGGNSPFQAEVFYINLAGVIQIKFGVPFFDVFDPRYLDFAVPVAVRGTMTFKITDYKSFIKLHRLSEFNLSQFQEQVRDAIVKYVKAIVTNIPESSGIPVIQLERKILEVNGFVENSLKPRFQEEFGVTVSSVDISALEVNKESEGYQSLKAVTKDITSQTVLKQHEVNMRNLDDMQRINAENLEATLAIQREQMAMAQKLQSESANYEAHRLNQQTRVAMANADAFGKMNTNGAGSINLGGGTGMNPGAMIAGMAIGSSIGQNMANTMNNVMQQSQGPSTPPPMPQITYFIVLDGNSAGPFDRNTIVNMIQSAKVSKETLIWKEGMAEWTKICDVPEFANYCNTVVVPPIPSMA